MPTNRFDRFAYYAWFVLGYNVFVILWGALVRATGSGAGCGRHWPGCQGQIVPLNPQAETLIEFTHRATSGLALLFVLGLVIWAFRAFSKGHRVRRGAVWSGVFIVIEALVGAGLVLFELVAENSSAARAVVISLHLANTFMLLGALTLTAWWGSGKPGFNIKGQGACGGWLWVSLGGLLLLGMSGAITALGDTLFSSEQIAQGVQHPLIQLRLWHPLLAIAVGALVWVGAHRVGSERPDAGGWAWALMGLYALQLGVGAFNVWLKAPLWLQLVHLGLADAIWIVFVVFAAAALAGYNTTSSIPESVGSTTS